MDLPNKLLICLAAVRVCGRGSTSRAERAGPKPQIGVRSSEVMTSAVTRQNLATSLGGYNL